MALFPSLSLSPFLHSQSCDKPLPSLPHGTLISQMHRVSLRTPGNRRHRPLRSSIGTNSDPSFNAESSRIFIKGLPRSTSEGYLAKTFSRFGEILRVKLITSKTFKESLGLAYIWFACEEDAHLAVKEMDGKFVDGRFIAVIMAMPESPSRHARTASYRF